MVYLLLISIGLIGVFFYNPVKDKGKKQWLCLYAFLCVANILVFGFRYRVGIDTLNYMLSFEQMTDLSDINLKDTATAPFFIILMSVCKSISSDFFLFQLVHSIVLNIVIFWYLYRNVFNPFLAYIVFFMTVGLYFNTEILKESFSICCFLIGYSLLCDKKLDKKFAYVYYFIFSLFAVGFHYGAVILFVVPLLRKLKFNYTLLFVSIFFLVILQSVFVLVMNFLPTEVLQERVSAYDGMISRGVLNMNYIIMAVMKFSFVPFVLLLFSEKNSIKNEKDLPMVCSLLLMGLGCINYQVMFQRFSNYFIIFFVCYLSNFFSIRKKYNAFYNVALFLLFATVYTYGIFVGGRYIIWFPYHSIFDPVKEPLRELMWSPYNL